MIHDLGDTFLIDMPYAQLDRTMGAYVLKGEHGRFMLIECGPRVLLDALLEGIASLGLAPENLTDLIVTHIHLDHAGNAGTLARRYGTRVHVFESGRDHLLDPTRLNASSRRTYGDSFDALMGEAEAVPEDRLTGFADGEQFTLHGRSFRVLHTPGHSGTHASLFVDGRDLYTGDSAGIRMPGTEFVKPATAPPEIDLDAWRSRIARMQALAPERILLTHFGAFTDAAAHFTRLRRQHVLWSREVLTGLKAGEDEAQLTARITRLSEAQMEEAGVSEQNRERYRVSSDYVMTVGGLARYWRKLQPDALSSTGFPLGRPASIAVVASGRGSNLAALIREFPAGSQTGEVVLVASDNAEAGALEIAERAGIPAFHLPGASRSEREQELDTLLHEHHIDLVCLAGYMRLLSPEFVARWEGRLVNIHPSLLPSFPGLDPYTQALEAGASESGCSVHAVDAGMDTGKVLLQRRVSVLPGDTPATLAARILEQEHIAYPEAVKRILNGGDQT